MENILWEPTDFVFIIDLDGDFVIVYNTDGITRLKAMTLHGMPVPSIDRADIDNYKVRKLIEIEPDRTFAVLTSKYLYEYNLDGECIDYYDLNE